MLIRHGAIFVGAKALPGLLGISTTIILTHLLSPAQYGLYGLSLIIMTFGSSIAFDWLLLCLTRFYEGRGRDPKVLGTILHIFAANTLLSWAGFAMLWLFGIVPRTIAAHYAIGLVLMWSYAWFELMACVEIVNLRSTAYFIMNSGRALGVLVLSTAAACLTHDAIWTAAGLALGMLSGSLLRRTTIPALGLTGFDAGFAYDMIAYGLPLAAAMLLGSLAFTGTRAMVGWLDSAEALGYYTVAVMLVQSTLVVVSSGIHAVNYQLIVRAVGTGRPEVARQQFLESGTFLLAAMAPASLGVALTAKEVAVALVATHYADAVASLTPWLAAGAFFGCMRSCYFDYAFQLGYRPLLLVRVLGVAAAIASVLAYWLIPRLGLEGAAIAVTISAVVSCVHAQIEGRAAFPLPLPFAEATKILAACGMMTIAMVSIDGYTPTRFAIQVGTGITVYLTSLLALDVLALRERARKHLAFGGGTTVAEQGTKGSSEVPLRMFRLTKESNRAGSATPVLDDPAPDLGR